MAIVYHGTMLERGILIAKRGAILSSYRLCIEENQHEGQQKCEGLSDYVSVVVGKIGRSRNHTRRSKDEEYPNGGLVLGIEVRDKILRKIEPNFINGSRLYIPNELSIETLVEVHLTRVANENHRIAVEEAFKKYNPRYSLLH